MRRVALIVCLLSLIGIAAAACGVGNDIGNAFRGAVDSLGDRVAPPLTDLSDCGVTSQLGFLCKLLRDIAVGTPEERLRAQEGAIRLFDLEESDEPATSFEVTVEFSGFELAQDERFEIDLKFSNSRHPGDIEALFSGVEFQPRLVGEPFFLKDAISPIRSSVAARLEELGNVDCEGTGKYAPKDRTETRTYCAPISHFRALEYHGPAQADARTRAGIARTHFLGVLTDAIVAPYVYASPPPVSGYSSTVTRTWGLSGGTGLYAIVFVPKSSVRTKPKLEIFAWLHPKGRPERPLGAEMRIPAVDFVERCLDDPLPNRTPPVDSKTTYGELCWYPFDLFGSAIISTLDELEREASLDARR